MESLSLNERRKEKKERKKGFVGDLKIHRPCRNIDFCSWSPRYGHVTQWHIFTLFVY